MNEKLASIANKKFVNLISNIKVNKNLLLDIVESSEELSTLLEWTKIDRDDLTLCFSSTKDNDAYQLMKQYCDGTKIIVLIKSENGKRFGGYTSGVNVSDITVTFYQNDNSFLFSLDNMKKYNVKNKEHAFIVQPEGFFSFGADLVIKRGFREGKINSSSFPFDYGTSENTLEEFNGGMRTFNIEEIEILTA